MIRVIEETTATNKYYKVAVKTLKKTRPLNPYYIIFL